ncbi:MAG: DotU family type IV/VI secretion system protein [Deltaproteobacteria bacterium]|nr:MAG: type VI secretion system protein ImpK [Desulfobacteraceae bacterium 4484_190.3]RLB17123.1 MAG: DotU family type IV/VI secretion system protein [Deltaproteobacteria bacterium]
MRLTDCFSELIAYVIYFLKAADQKEAPFDKVRTDVQRLLSEAETSAKGAGISDADFDLARFAVCAWVDEGILNSTWQGKAEWQREPLQRLYYSTAAAGELFYEKLNALGLQQHDVREIFYLCLAMGFKGRYCNEGDDFLLDQLKTSNLKLLAGSSIGIPSIEKENLFPDAYPTSADAPVSSGKKSRFINPTVLVSLIGPVALFGLLFWIYRFILGNVADNFMSMVP